MKESQNKLFQKWNGKVGRHLVWPTNARKYLFVQNNHLEVIAGLLSLDQMNWTVNRKIIKIVICNSSPLNSTINVRLYFWKRGRKLCLTLPLSFTMGRNLNRNLPSLSLLLVFWWNLRNRKEINESAWNWQEESLRTSTCPFYPWCFHY